MSMRCAEFLMPASFAAVRRSPFSMALCVALFSDPMRARVSPA
jgi:hypothetical protein